jgi:CDP-glucose 4,6-dehydratase
MGEMVSFYQGKKVFITGHTGFKGSWLSEILIEAGATIRGYSLAPCTQPNLFNLLNLENKMDSIIADIRDLDTLKKSIEEFQPEIVLHLAAQPIVRESYKNPVDTYSSNVMGTVNILEACRNVKSIKSIVNITTDKVYENKEREEGYSENENLCGYDPYSNSKSCSELVTFSYRNSFYHENSSPSLSTARSGNVIGGGDFSADRIIPDCVRASMENKPIIVRNPLSTRPYQHVLDCLNGYLVLAKAQYDKTLVGSYNFGPNDCDCLSTGDLVDKFCFYWKDARWEDRYDGGPHEANFLKLKCDKSKTKLLWKPTWGIDKAIENTVNWYKSYANGEDVAKITELQIKEFFNE